MSRPGPLPDWIYSLKSLTGSVETLAEFASDPATFIREKVAVWVVSGVIAVIEAFTGRVSWLWDIIVGAVATAWNSVDVAFGGSAEVLLDALRVVPNLLVELSNSLGILGPVVVGVGLVLVFLALWMAIKRAPGALWTLYQAIPGT